jgi:hypothetical protein
MKPSRSSPDDAGSTLAEVDYYTGRIVRIPGVYPWQERVMRWRPLIYVAIATALFVVVGILQSI